MWAPPNILTRTTGQIFWGHGERTLRTTPVIGGPTVIAEQTLKSVFSLRDTGTVFGFKAGLVDINWLKRKTEPHHKVHPDPAQPFPFSLLRRLLNARMEGAALRYQQLRGQA